MRALQGCSAAAEPAEDRKRVLWRYLPDELAAGLDLAVDAPGELPGLLLGSRAGDHIAEAANDLVALALELVGELLRGPVRVSLGPDLPGRVPVLHFFLLPRLLRRLARPALLLLEPVLDGRDLGLDPLLRELGLDDGPRLLGLLRRGRVDEELVVVAGDRQPASLELARETLRLVGAQVEAEPAEEILSLLFAGQLDPDAPVVSHAVAPSRSSVKGCPNILSDLPVWSRNLVIPPSQNGQPAPSRRAVSTSAASATTPSASRWWTSSATASRAASRISSGS